MKDAALAPQPTVQAEITKLQDTADLFTRKIEIERRRVEAGPPLCTKNIVLIRGLHLSAFQLNLSRF